MEYFKRKFVINQQKVEISIDCMTSLPQNVSFPTLIHIFYVGIPNRFYFDPKIILKLLLSDNYEGANPPEDQRKRLVNFC